MIDWSLERREVFPDRVLGWLLIGGRRFCWTLEPSPTAPAHPAMPEGTYPLRLRYSPHFSMDLPHVDEVPGRSAIEIHAGNVPADTKGCVLVGDRGPGNDLAHSRMTLALLVATLRDALTLDEAQLEVRTRPVPPGPDWA